MISQNSIIKSVKKYKDRMNNPVFILIIKNLFIVTLALHFLILALYQLPDNPIKHQFKYKLHAYVNPFFSQSWTLFAPNPINSNNSLLIRFKYDDNDQEYITEWIDITEPLIKDRENNFWSPSQRVNKFIQSCMSNVLENNKIILEEMAKLDSTNQDVNNTKTFYREAMSMTNGYRLIQQYSGFVAKDYFMSEGIKASEVKLQFRILSARFPRFSKRKENYYDLNNYEFTEMTSDFLIIEY